MPSLVTFPYAGASESAFRGWDALLAPQLRLRPFTLPGRGSRSTEPLITAMNALVADVLTHVGGDDEILFGHSMGALVAFEAARQLERRHPDGGRPKALVVSGHDAPHRVSPTLDRPRHTLPDADLVELLRDYGGTPDELLRHDVLKHFLPALRADLSVVETYAFHPGPALSCPIVCYCATDDTETTLEGSRAWAELTRGSFSIREFTGGHFYLREEAVICRALQHDLDGNN